MLLEIQVVGGCMHKGIEMILEREMASDVIESITHIVAELEKLIAELRRLM